MKHKYISKFDYDKSRGYWVRLPEIVEGKYVSYEGESRFFGRGFYKTWKACLADAVLFRDAFIKKHKSLNLLNRVCGRIDKPMVNTGRNTSGAIGVTLTVDHKEAGDYYGYKGQWVQEIRGIRKQRGMQFSCNEYGEDKAFKLACRVRHEHCGPIIIKDVKAIPCFPDVEYLIKEST